TASLTVVTPAPGGGTSAARTFTINAPVPSGTGTLAISVVAVLTMTPSALTFGEQTVGTSSVAQGVQIKNTGTTPVAVTVTTAAPFSITQNLCLPIAGTWDGQLAPGTWCDVAITFTPAISGAATGTLTIAVTSSAPVPMLTALTPTSALAGGPAFTLTVTGSSFVNGSTVRWNGTARTTTFVSATQLTAAIPAGDIGAPGTASLTVVTPAPGGGTSAARTFTINAPAPTLATLMPSNTLVGGTGLTLTVTGTNFAASSVVRWNGTGRTTTFVSATQLTAAIAAADVAAQGTASVTVFTPTPGGGTSAARTFTINAPVPTLSTLTPASVTAPGGAFTLTVTGTNFVAASQVRWNGAARTTTFVSATQLTAAVAAADAAAPGTAPVTVFTPTPGGGTSGALAFTIDAPAPVLSALAPSSVAAGGAAFTLGVTGSGFVATSQVFWNGTARTTSFVSATQLTAAIA